MYNDIIRRVPETVQKKPCNYNGQQQVENSIQLRK